MICQLFSGERLNIPDASRK